MDFPSSGVDEMTRFHYLKPDEPEPINKALSFRPKGEILLLIEEQDFSLRSK